MRLGQHDYVDCFAVLSQIRSLPQHGLAAPQLLVICPSLRDPVPIGVLDLDDIVRSAWIPGQWNIRGKYLQTTAEYSEHPDNYEMIGSKVSRHINTPRYPCLLVSIKPGSKPVTGYLSIPFGSLFSNVGDFLMSQFFAELIALTTS